MHICYITRNYDERSMGGRNPSLRYFQARLRAMGHRVTIVSVPRHPENANTVQDNVHYTSYWADRSYDVNLLAAIPRLVGATAAVHRAQPIDVLHCLYREFDGIAAVILKFRLGLPLVQWMYDLGFSAQKWVLVNTRKVGLLAPFLLAYLWLGERLVLGCADRILAIGQDIVEQSLTPRGYVAPQVVLVNNTVDTDQFHPREPDRAVVGSPPPERPVVLMVARIDRSKGIEEFVEIAARVLAQRPEVQFVVMGSDKDAQLPIFQARAKELGVDHRFTWLSERPDVEHAYTAADCVAICTLPVLGGIANVLLEAMASARPVVANRANGVPFVIRDWENGVSIPDNARAPFAEAILKILADRELARKLGEAARETVLTRFSLDATARTLEGVYRELCGRA